MNLLTLSGDGRLCQDGLPVQGDPLQYLGYKVDLEEKATLRTIFKLMDRYSDLQRLSPFFPDCLQRFKQCPESGCRDPELDRLELTKTVEMIGYPGPPRLEIYCSLKGISGEEAREIRFSSLELLLDLPLTIGRLRHVVFGDRVDLFEFDMVVTLFELVDGVVWELSFIGTPKACEIRR